jgi:hypothetical protein
MVLELGLPARGRRLHLGRSVVRTTFVRRFDLNDCKPCLFRETLRHASVDNRVAQTPVTLALASSNMRRAREEKSVPLALGVRPFSQETSD